MAVVLTEEETSELCIGFPNGSLRFKIPKKIAEQIKRSHPELLDNHTSIEDPCPHCNGTELIELRNELGDVWTHKKCPYCHRSINMGGDYGSRSEY